MKFYISVLLILLCAIHFSTGQVLPDSGYIEIDLPEHLSLQVNDTLIDFKNIQCLPVTPGIQNLALRPSTHRSWYMAPARRSVKVAPGDTVSLPFNNTDFLYEAPPPYKTVDLKTSIISGERQKGFRLKKMVKPALLVTAVVANWSAFYLRRRADDFYGEYARTSDVSKLNFYYNKASKYDQYASAALGVSVAATSTLLFVLMFGD